MNEETAIENAFLDSLIELCYGVGQDRKNRLKAKVALKWELKFREGKKEIQKETAKANRPGRKAIHA